MFVLWCDKQVAYEYFGLIFCLTLSSIETVITFNKYYKLNFQLTMGRALRSKSINILWGTGLPGIN